MFLIADGLRLRPADDGRHPPQDLRQGVHLRGESCTHDSRKTYAFWEFSTPPGQVTHHIFSFFRCHMYMLPQDADEAAEKNRVAFVSADMGMLGHLIKGRVLQDLQALFPGRQTCH